MGLYVCCRDYFVRPNYIKLENYNYTVLVLDTDDLVVEECTVRELVKYAEYLEFENLVKLAMSKYRLDSFFEDGEVIKIGVIGMTLFLESVDTGIKSWNIKVLHVFCSGVGYKVSIRLTRSFPDFQEDKLVFHDIAVGTELGAFLTGNLIIPYDGSDIVFMRVLVTGDLERMSIKGKPCTETSFMSSIILGV